MQEPVVNRCFIYLYFCLATKRLVHQSLYLLNHNACFSLSYFLLGFYGPFKNYLLARLDEVQEELLYYPRRQSWRQALAKSLMLKFFCVMGKVLSGELSRPCDRSCLY